MSCHEKEVVAEMVKEVEAVAPATNEVVEQDELLLAPLQLRPDDLIVQVGGTKTSLQSLTVEPQKHLQVLRSGKIVDLVIA